MAMVENESMRRCTNQQLRQLLGAERMQPDEEEMNSEEHEILFDDDDDNLAQEPISSSPKNAFQHPTDGIDSSEEQPLANFQPLEVHSTEALSAAVRLESFLSSESTEFSLAPTGPLPTPISVIRVDAANGRNPCGTSAGVQNASEHPLASTPFIVRSTPPMRGSSSLDPFTKSTIFLPPTASLFDAVLDAEEDKIDGDDVEMTRCRVHGDAGFLEMEEEPSRMAALSSVPTNKCSIFDPIQTSSGLLLTHRRIPPSQDTDSRSRLTEGTASKNRRKYLSSTTFNSSSYLSFGPRLDRWSIWQPFPSLLQYIRVGLAISAVILFFGTVVIVHQSLEADVESHSITNMKTAADGTISFHEQNGIFTLQGPYDSNVQLVPLTDDSIEPDQIILLPLPSADSGSRHTKQRRLTPLQVAMTSPEWDLGVVQLDDSLERNSKSRFPRTALGSSTPFSALRTEFEAWTIRHNKTYDTKEEHHRRFQIWSDNHHRTSEKNSRHGPCQLTGKPVFGVNQFHDLTNEEFQSQYLNGYHLKREPIRKGEISEQPIMGVHVEPPRLHPILHQRLLEQKVHGTIRLDYQGNCKWYDVSCILRYLFSTFLYGLGGTMEPAYDANSYPTAIDWRALGAVTDVHSQGSCGACWAITAVETVESAHYITTGQLYDLAETEVIVCEAKCEMCAGGWPQEAFDYVIANNGLPLESDITYNADFLLLVSEHVAGNSDELDDTTVSTFQQQTCPSGGGSGNDHHSGDSESISGSNTYSRYGKIKGYGYSTEKCVCYTDGSGCDCDHQNEGYAVRNLATYGPAVVCLDASTWQDYTEGIITSESGCSAGFMDVNHCVQAVGYAYMSDEEYQDEMDGKNSGDRDHNSKDGSRDSAQRKGYWIVRNQWSRYWGMNGYAYVAMGENTCGILNDMMQAYT